MASSRSRSSEKSRLKTYRAHQIVHHTQEKRRVRDQWLAGLIMVAAVTVSGLGYWGWATIGPGAPEAAEPATEEEQAELEEALDELIGEDGAEISPVPDIALSEYRAWDASMTIDGVELDVTLNGFVAPQAVANFLSLSEQGFYDGVSCHRLTTAGIFVLQCGDPEGTGRGGPGYTFGPIENAPADDSYPAGTLAMARSGGDGASMGSQFFIVYDDSTIPADSAGGYTVFGEITSGLDQLVSDIVSQGTIDEVPDGNPLAPAEIRNITIR